MGKAWRGATLLLGLIGVVAVGWISLQVGTKIHVANAVVSHTLCAGAFISGVDPRQLYIDTALSDRGLAKLDSHRRYVIDRTQRTVEVTWAGHFREVAEYRDDLGCVLIHDQLFMPLPGSATQGVSAKADASNTRADLVIAAPTPAIEAALTDAFREPSDGPRRRTKAVVVLHRGRIIGERYAAGYNAGTSIMGYSVSKSITSALIGILVKQRKLSLSAPAPIAEWSNPSDPRHAITVDELLRMTSGLSLEESDSGLDPVSRMLFLEKNMAGFAEKSRLQRTPGSAWEYTSGNTLILSRILRDAVGGSADAVRRFAQKELFEPLGITSAHIDFDVTGTPVGSMYIYATARDWARFGSLYLHDGSINGRQILPAGWVAYSATPTLSTDYGAGFWTNRMAHGDAADRIAAGLPEDSFYASGNFGQRVLIEPSRNLVIVRLGQSHGPGQDIRGLLHLSAAIARSLPVNESDSKTK
jgi:hypothetical protein